MRPILTPEEMARADEATIAAGTPVEVLMERAGRAVARSAIDMLGGRYGKKVIVVCGKGNNGGDGYAAAWVLRGEGVGVRCLAVVEPSELKGAALHHYEKAKNAGVRTDSFDAEMLPKADLVVDAIFGTGFSSPREDEGNPFLQAIDAFQRLKEGEVWGLGDFDPDHPSPKVLAVDIPSGMSGERGPVSGTHVMADHTVALGAEKLGTFVGDPRYVGTVEVADIGIKILHSQCVALDASDVRSVIPVRRPDGHKRSSGSVAVLAGSDAMTGAAALVVQGAMRAGAGYVTIATTSAAAQVVRERCPEALVRVSDKPNLGPSVLDDLSDVFERANVVAIGPGIGQGDEQRQLVQRILREFEGPVVIDADGINVISAAPEVLSREKQNLVMTPHPAELARVLNLDVRQIQDARIESVIQTVKRFDCQVVLKGYRSVVGHPNEDAVRFLSDEESAKLKAEGKLKGPFFRYTGVDIKLNPTGGPSLATAGTGDVLTGAIAAWVAASPSDWRYAAVAGMVYVHGLAGDVVGDGALAWDVAEALPEAIALVRDGVPDDPWDLSDRV